MEATSSLYPITCGCGHLNHVPAQKAGTEILCGSCGGALLVPTFSKLKELGQIASMQRHESEAPTLELEPGQVEVAQRHVRRPHSGWKSVLWNVIGAGVGIGLFVLFFQFLLPRPPAGGIKPTVVDELTGREIPDVSPSWIGNWSGEFEGFSSAALIVPGRKAVPIVRGSISVEINKSAYETTARFTLTFRRQGELSDESHVFSYRVADETIDSISFGHGTMRRTGFDETAKLHLSSLKNLGSLNDVGMANIDISANLKRSP